MIWKLSEMELWQVFRQYAKCQQFWIVSGCQWYVELRPVFRQVVDIWNISCKAIWRADCHRETLKTRKLHFRTWVATNYFYYLHTRNSFLKLCRVLTTLQKKVCSPSSCPFLLPFHSSFISLSLFPYCFKCVSNSASGNANRCILSHCVKNHTNFVC
jgi:hypothetical protein